LISTAFVSASLTVLLAFPTLLSAATPMSPSAPRQARATPAFPTFQAVGIFGDLAVLDPNNLLSAATFLQPDSGDFGLAFFITGLALDPVSGKVYVAGNDVFSDSYLGQVNFKTGEVTSVGTIAGEIVVDIAFDGAGQLYGLTDNGNGTTPHALLRINKTTGAATVAKVLAAHGGTADSFQFGAIAWNPADSSLYYADKNNDSPVRQLFIDRLTPGTFAQTTALTTSSSTPYAMAFTQGRLWLATSGAFYSANAANFALGLKNEGFSLFPTADGEFSFVAEGLFPAVLPCIPSTTAACLFNRFKVEVTYDATPNNGSGPGSVVLESDGSVKFTFFDPSNIELIVKVLNACQPPFNKWWTFGGGLTNVGVTIKITDTSNGAVKTYTSTKGKLFQPFADTAAFNCP
jgi:hypothetical protein